jgi:hypothetical protein
MLAPNILMIRDETAMGEIMYELEMVFSKKRISVKDIIIERVKYEVDNYNSKVTDQYYGLVQPKNAEQLLNKFKLNSKAKVDVDKQIKVALLAFQSNGFFLLVDDEQVEELEQMVDVSEHQTVSFIKLTPLVGG